MRWLPRRWPRLQARAEVFRTLQSLLHLSALIKDDLPAAFLETSKAYICLSPAAMINSSSSSHARWQGAARWKQGWNDAWKGWDDSSTTTSPISESIPDERVTNALHLMQDHLQQTTVIAQERSQKTHTQQAASKTQGNAAHEVMEAATQGCLPAPSSSKPEEREFVVDSRAFDAHAEQERSEFSGTGDGFEYPETRQRLSRPMEKCKQTRKQQCTSTIWIYS